MADQNTITVIGFDLGHGDTALARVGVDTRPESGSLSERNAPVSMVELSGNRRQQITAVAVRHGDGQVLVGWEAVSEPDADLFTAFKGPDVRSEKVRRPVLLFAGALVEQVRARRLGAGGKIHWVFGHPSGWRREEVGRYRELLAEVCGKDQVSVIPESRAALLYARDSGDVPGAGGGGSAAEGGADAGGPAVLRASTLIVDVGSSTTDYTRVVSGAARPFDHGNVDLGAHLIDKTIMNLVVDRAGHADVIRRALDADASGSAWRELEMHCRRLKEMFFDKPAAYFDRRPFVGLSEQVFTRDGEPLEIQLRLSRDDMAAILDTPQPGLGGLTWREAFCRDLSAAVEEAEPEVVLLTGGPSRMPWLQQAARELAPGAEVLVGTEPEFAIARGLALAGRMDERIRGFREDVRVFTEGKFLRTAVDKRLPALTEAMAEAVASKMTERHVVPAFRAWRDGEISTLDAMRDRIVEGVQGDFSPDNKTLEKAVTDWQNKLRPELAQQTDVICARWNLAPGSLTLPKLSVQRDDLPVRVDTSHATSSLAQVSLAVNAAASGVAATILFGAGMALVAPTGPAGWAVGAVVLFLGGLFAQEKIMENIGDKNVPGWLRELRSEESLLKKIRAKAPEQEKQFAASLERQLREEGGGQLGKDVTAAVRSQLMSVAAEAEMQIS